jgi:hypothetical protein
MMAYNGGMSDSAEPSRGSITDSPWYWVYLFATGALVALMLAGPKFAARQANIEQNQQSRIRAAQLVAGDEVDAAEDADTPTSTQITLWPLYIVLGIGLGFAWLNLIRNRLAAKRQATAATSSSEALP